MIKNIPFRAIFSALSLSFFALTFHSCVKDDFDATPDLVEPEMKERKINTGFTDHVVEIKGETWSIPYIKDGVTGDLLKDSLGQPYRLDAIGSKRLEKGWLNIEMTAEHKLKMNLLENFSDSPRHFVVGLISDNKKDEFSVIQSRGEAYELVDRKIEEIAGSRKIYVSTEGCSTMEVSNPGNQPLEVEIKDIYKGVNYSSEFASEDYGAFEWMGKTDSLVNMGELLVDGEMRWSKQVPYRKGSSLEPFLNAGYSSKITLQPGQNNLISGEMEYLERSCTYTFTIKNKTSGNQFKVSGIWKQKVPLTPKTIIN